MAQRGQIWWADLGFEVNKRVIVISNNQRNRALKSCIALYVTSKWNKPPYPSLARFEVGEIGELPSFVCADDPWVVPDGDLKGFITTATPTQMLRVEDAVRAALDLH